MSQLAATIVLVTTLVGGLYFKFLIPPMVPVIEVEYWGPFPVRGDDITIRPFIINFPDSAIEELHTKLSQTYYLTPPLEGMGFEYGTNTKYMLEFLNFWRNGYNWTERQAYLNSLPHFKTQIGGLNIHFIHVKPSEAQAKGKTILPLLLVHGWPGSVREFYDIIPLLTTPRDDMDFVFEVVAPSLPGFGFSDSAVRQGMGPPQMAAIFAKLMTRLGHKQYYYQGGDWGSVIGHSSAVLYPDRVLGFHCNFCLSTTLTANMNVFLAYLFPKIFVDEPRREFFLNQFFDSMVLESGYYHIQATKPDTIGIALTDSPVGLAAYLLEKFSTATNKNFRALEDGGLEKMDKVEILDNIMIYWLTKSITTSIRLYSENYVQETYTRAITRNAVRVPTHCARFPNELLYYPNIVLRQQYNLFSFTDFPRGGHFAAMEEPNLLADDLFSFVNKLRKSNKKVEL